MINAMAERLSEAAERRQLVRLTRSFEEHRIRGYVLDIGVEFFSLALISDRLWYDGFECLRIADVDSVQDDPYAHFAESALTLRSQTQPILDGLQLSSVASILSSAGERFQLVAIHKEMHDPDVCNIGHVVSVEGNLVWLLEITPGAVWEVEPTPHRLREITRVDFGGDYENALALVGGEPPPNVTRPTVPLRLVAKAPPSR
jgi:hypothetical protein